MQSKLSNNFEKNLYIIYEFISKDKLSAAQNFKKELLKTIKALSDFPLKYRKSYYFDDENIRDLTFKGYTIVYEVDFDIDLVFEEWINLLGFLGESIKSLRIIFYVIENEDKFLSYHLKAVKGTLIVDSERWLNHFEELTPNEALILHKVLNT